MATTGIGVRQPGLRLGLDQIRAGDVVMVSGPVGDHGTAVLLAREDFGLKGDLASDAASILPLARALWSLPGLRFMRDPTRDGLATVMHDIAHATGLSAHLDEAAIPVNAPVRAVCDMLGYDPLYLACEGWILAVPLGCTRAARPGPLARFAGRRSRRDHRTIGWRSSAGRVVH